MLTGHETFRPSITPIQLFNKATDPFLPGVKPHLFQILRALDDRGLDNLVLIITRFRVTEADMAVLEELRHLRVTLLFTYSGITDARVEPIAKSNITVSSLATACQHKKRTKVVLYWRPIVPGWNDAPETMRHVLDVGDAVDAIVFTGYYHKPENATYLRAQGVELPYDEDDFHRRKTMPAELDARVVAAWRASGIRTPLFRKTSCGVSFAHGLPDYNGHWGVRELCDICPIAQQDLLRGQPHGTQPGRVRTGPRTDLGYCSAVPHRRRTRPRVDPRPRGTAPLPHPAHPPATRSGNWTNPTTYTPTAAPSPATAPPRQNTKHSRRYASGSPPRHALMKTTDPCSRGERQWRAVQTCVDTGAPGRTRPGGHRRPGPRRRGDPGDRRRPHHRRPPVSRRGLHHAHQPEAGRSHAGRGSHPGSPTPHSRPRRHCPTSRQNSLRRLSGKILVGHNVPVDWRLLRRRCPSIQPAGLIDTLRLARHLHPGLRQKSLGALIEHYNSTTKSPDRTEQPAPSRSMGHHRRSTADRGIDQRPAQQQIA